MLKNVYSLTESDRTPPRSLNEVINQLKKKGILTAVGKKHTLFIQGLSSYVQMMGNEAVHTVKISIDGIETYVPQEVSIEDAYPTLLALLNMAEWYLDWIRDHHPDAKLKYTIKDPATI